MSNKSISRLPPTKAGGVSLKLIYSHLLLDVCDNTKRCCLRCSRPLCSSQNTGGTPHQPSKQLIPGSVRPSPALPKKYRHMVQSFRFPPRWGPVPQDPTACTRNTTHNRPFHTPKGGTQQCCVQYSNVNVPPMSATGKHMFP